MIVLFQFFNHFLCRFASRFYQNIYCGKNTNYPLTTKQNDRFASCANIVSRSQTSSLLPPPPPPIPGKTNTTGLLVIMKPLIYVISMELLSLRRRISPGETSLAVLEASSEESRLFSQAM